MSLYDLQRFIMYIFVHSRFEDAREFISAQKAYERSFKEFGNQEAKEALQKLQLTVQKQQNGRDLIDLTEDEEAREERDQRNQDQHKVMRQDRDAVARRQRLLELERFKQSLNTKRVRR